MTLEELYKIKIVLEVLKRISANAIPHPREANIVEATINEANLVLEIIDREIKDAN